MSNFQMLTDEQHVILRKGLYVGEDSQVKVKGYFINNGSCQYSELEINPALCKIVNEIIDNSVDEFIRTDGKHSSKIDVEIENLQDTFKVTVTDNGKGIPVKIVDGTTEYQPVLCWSRAKAGSNFGKSISGAGQYGVGSFLTYVFSDYFIGETCDGSNKLTFTKPNKVEVSPSKKHGTVVKFAPNLSHFNIKMDEFIYSQLVEFIKQRLINLSICYPKINFTFNGENVSLKLVEVFAKAISDDYVLLREEKYAIIVASTADVQEFRFHNYTNGLYNINGGSLVDYVSSNLATALIPLIKRKHKVEVTSGQIKNNLFLGIFASGFVNLKFDSQTKERVTNSVKEVAEYFNLDFNSLAKKVILNDSIIDPIVKSILFKQQQLENLALAREQKKAKKENIANHIPATFKDRSECSVFLLEGLSALGQGLAARENNKIGMYAMQGKIDNVLEMKPSDMIKVPVIKDLLTVTGLTLGKPPVDLEYGKIIINSDADVDGSCIAELLINFFALWGEPLFDRIYRVLPPLYKLTKKGKQPLYFYSLEEYQAFDSKGYTVKYLKGLGSMSKDDYADMINNPKLIKIKWDENSKQVLDMIFAKKRTDERKEWLMNDYLTQGNE